MRALRYNHRLCDRAAAQRANFDGDHGKRGAMAIASPDERPTAHALVATRGPSDAQGSMRGDERYPRTRLCHLRKVGGSSLSARSMTRQVETVSLRFEFKQQRHYGMKLNLTSPRRTASPGWSRRSGARAMPQQW